MLRRGFSRFSFVVGCLVALSASACATEDTSESPSDIAPAQDDMDAGPVTDAALAQQMDTASPKKDAGVSQDSGSTLHDAAVPPPVDANVPDTNVVVTGEDCDNSNLNAVKYNLEYLQNISTATPCPCVSGLCCYGKLACVAK